MKKMRKIASLLLALVMVLSMAMTAFAAEESGVADAKYTITINNTTEGYEYEAYQIFKGDLSQKEGELAVLSNIDWGSGVNTATSVDDKNLMAALKSLVVGDENAQPFKACVTAADVAKVLADTNTGKDNDIAKAFADVVGQYLNTTSQGTSSEEQGTYSIGLNEPGYYLVKNREVPEVGEDTAEGSFTRYILQVVNNVEVTHKGDVPEVDKYIVEDDEEGTATDVKVNEASIGDTIKYKLVGTLPSNIADYDTYSYKFTDTLSAGLTITDTDPDTIGISTDVTVYIDIDGDGDEVPVDVTESFVIGYETNDETGVTTLSVSILNLLALDDDTNADTAGEQSAVPAITKDTKVIVTYSAVLNENAVVGGSGNENTVDLEYSNDPNEGGEGETGKTPEDEVYTYTTDLTITKTDGEKILPGAAFKIKGEGTTPVVTIGKVYVKCIEEQCEEGQHYLKSADGIYSEASDAEEGVDKYHQFDKVTVDSNDSAVEFEAFVTDDEGKLIFEGLGAGTYTITETVTPDGYNTIKPIKVTITCTFDKDNKPTWKYDWEDEEYGESGNNVTIVNQAGSTLPSTGGMGTTIFYVIGGVLVLAAVVLLITKRRMSIEE